MYALKHVLRCGAKAVSRFVRCGTEAAAQLRKLAFSLLFHVQEAFLFKWERH